jgi:hypothetical protein
MFFGCLCVDPIGMFGAGDCVFASEVLSALVLPTRSCAAGPAPALLRPSADCAGFLAGLLLSAVLG